jgi:hypothetical protein
MQGNGVLYKAFGDYNPRAMAVVISSWLRLTRGRGDGEKFSAYYQLILTARPCYGH